MSSIAVEDLMALLYTNQSVRQAFIRNPRPWLARYELSESESASFLEMDLPGLTLAGNSFGYKRWKANQWRHARCYQFLAYSNVLSSTNLNSVADLASSSFCEHRWRRRKLKSTLAGETCDLLDVMPENQINFEHVLLEADDSFEPLKRAWRQITQLACHQHYLIRAYLFKARTETVTTPSALHPRPGSATVYIPLPTRAPRETAMMAYALQNNGELIREDEMNPGTMIVYPSDVVQGIRTRNGHPPESNLTLCMKTLCASV
jgi:hypothetical protein